MPNTPYIDSNQTKQINSREFVNSGFRSVVVITSASHAEGRPFNSGRKLCLLCFFLYGTKIEGGEGIRLTTFLLVCLFVCFLTGPILSLKIGLQLPEHNHIKTLANCSFEATLLE